MEKIHFSEICVICLDNESSHVFRPCLHMCICDVCTHQYVRRNDNTCPMCRKQYTSVEFHERPPTEIVKDDFDDIFAKVLTISEEEALTYEILKNEEEEHYNQAVLESLLYEDSIKMSRFSQRMVNLARSSSSNNIHSDVSRGAIPKISKPFKISTSGAAVTPTSSSELQKRIVSNNPLEIYVQLRETAIIYYNKNRRKTSERSTGTMSLIIFSKDISLNTLRNISSNDSLLFKLDNTSTLKNIKHDSSVKSQITEDKNRMYIACDKLVPNLRDLMKQNPSSFSYNLNVFNYNINSNKYPLDIDFFFFGDLLNSQLTMNYKYCPERIYPETSLRKFKLTVRFDTPFANVDCVPTAKVDSKYNELYWSFDEIAGSNGTGCLSANCNFFTKKTPLVARISLEYSCLDASLSRIKLDETGMRISPNYRIKDIGRRLIIKEFFIVVENNERT